MLFLVGLFLLLVPLPAPLPPPASKARNLPVALLTGLSGMAYLLWIASYLRSRVRRASHSMDPVFLKHGFQLGKSYAIARTFRGEHDGMAITGDLFPDYKLHPWRLSLRGSVLTGVQAVLSNRQPVILGPKMSRFPAEGRLSSIFIYGDHPQWLEKILGQSHTIQRLESIRTTLSTSDTWQLIVEPQSLQLRIMTYTMTTDHMGIWLDSFFHLAKTFSTPGKTPE
ncbi:MAG: hypothetical protein FJY82_03990 [Candidatus Aminicenantes bacterium]|nr:hypothetical protein [Candidatus Aminicenantes bacterium]